MSPPHRTERNHRLGRRALVRSLLTAGAALGLAQSRALDVLAGVGGHALADDAACARTHRSVHLVAGRGGLAWFHLLWPQVDIAEARDERLAFHSPAEGTRVVGTDRALILAPEAPFRTFSPDRQITAMMAGRNETHTRRPTSSITLANGIDLFAACAAAQSADPSLVPVIAIDGAPYGSAPAAPAVTRVPDAGSFADLFGAAASREGGILSRPENADLFETAYRGFAALRSTAGSPQARAALGVGASAARLLSRNLAEQLRPTAEDLARYGVHASTRRPSIALAESLITTAKAFALGLTQSVILPALEDDPHTAFNDLARLRDTLRTLGRSLDAFFEDLSRVEDARCAGKRLADQVVLTIHGDTPKHPLTRRGWPDSTPFGTNWIYVLGAGHLRSGWLGGVDRGGAVRGWSPVTGADVSHDRLASAEAASAAVLFAVTRGDLARVREVHRAPISAVVRSVEG